MGKSVVALLFASVAGVAVGVLFVALFMPGWVVYIYAVAGLFGSAAASLALGLPVLQLARSGRALRLPSLVLAAVIAALALTVLAHCAFLSCLAGPWLSFVFALICAVVTAVVAHAILPRENAL